MAIAQKTSKDAGGEMQTASQYGEDFFRQFASPAELAKAIEKYPSSEQISILASLYKILQDDYYDQARAGKAAANLNSIDGMWENFLAGKNTGVCRDHAYLVQQIAQMAGIEATMVAFSTQPTSHAIPALKTKDGQIYLVDSFGIIEVPKGASLYEQLMMSERSLSPFVYDAGRAVETESGKWLRDRTGVYTNPLSASYFYHLLSERPTGKKFEFKYDDGVVASVKGANHSLTMFYISNPNPNIAIDLAKGAAYGFYGSKKLAEQTSAIVDGSLMILDASLKQPSGRILLFEDLPKDKSNLTALAQAGAYLEQRIGNAGTSRLIAGLNGFAQMPLSSAAGTAGSLSVPVLGIYENKEKSLQLFAGVVPYASIAKDAGEGEETHGITARTKVVAGAGGRKDFGHVEAKLGILAEKEIGEDIHEVSANVSLSKELKNIGLPVKVVAGAEFRQTATPLQKINVQTFSTGLEGMPKKNAGWWVGVEHERRSDGTKQTRVTGGLRVFF